MLDDGILDQDTYENSRKKLLKKKEKLLNKNKSTEKKKRTTQLEKELEVIKTLFDDGLLSKEEYERTRDLLIEKDGNREVKKKEKLKPYELRIIGKKKSKNWILKGFVLNC